MSYVEIVEDEEQFDLPIGESIFHLKRLDSEVYERIVKQHTTTKWRRGQRVKETDDFAVNKDLLDHLIDGWEKVKSPTTGKDVPCTRESKLKLPSSTKVDIIEACDADHITTGPPEGEDKKKQLEQS